MSKLKAVDPKKAEPSRPKVLVFGRPNVGKTFVSLDFPNCYFIDTEEGATRSHYTDKLVKSGGVYFGPEQGSLDFNSVIEEVKTLATEKHPYKTLIIDSFTKLYNIATFEAAEKGGDDFGRDKKEANKPTRRLMNWLSRIDMNVILTAHEKPLWGLDAKGNRSEIGVTFDGYDKLEYDLDLILNVVKNGPARKARVVKTRLVGFPEASNFDWSYNDFAERWGKDVIEQSSKQVVLATPEQVANLKDTLENIKLPEGQLDKWLQAAKAGKIEDLESSAAEKIINHINQKFKGAK